VSASSVCSFKVNKLLVELRLLYCYARSGFYGSRLRDNLWS
jgi:hypothetical protein